ncbi:MAG: hypothetical protein HKN09_12165 [Saprospiraceae bacterium]|nr:hypothetical protein [Saprospiraceae bacterium]
MTKEWKQLVAKGKTAKVITALLTELEAIDNDEYLNQIVMLSYRQEELKKKVMSELVTEGQAKVDQNRINNALLYTLDEIDDEELFSGQPEAVDTGKDAPEPIPIENLTNLDELKERATYVQKELAYLRKEETMTLPGRGLFALENQIKEAEIELDELKDKIRNFA